MQLYIDLCMTFMQFVAVKLKVIFFYVFFVVYLLYSSVKLCRVDVHLKVKLNQERYDSTPDPGERVRDAHHRDVGLGSGAPRRLLGSCPGAEQSAFPPGKHEPPPGASLPRFGA